METTKTPTRRGRLLTSLADLATVRSPVVALFSGGLDSTFLLDWSVKSGVEVAPLRISLGGNAAPDELDDVQRGLGLTVVEIEATERFADEYVRRGIKANCMHQGVFPISSSLSRPLIAGIAVEVARDIGAACIVHTADFHQNSCARFNNSVRALAPELDIANPLLGEDLSRQDKLLVLRAAGLAPPHGIYSVDENVWARVIENGELDFVGHPVPNHVFAWTKSPRTAPSDATTVRLTFREGVPAGLDGTGLSLSEIIRRLNVIGGEYGVGRYNGCEQTRFGMKNHEVREAPAATIILSAHRHLEQLVLTDEELATKRSIDDQWTRLAVGGHWFSDLMAALTAFEDRLAQLVDGHVDVVLEPGSAYVTAISAEGSLAGNMHSPASDGKPSGGYSFERAFDSDTTHLAVRGLTPTRSSERTDA